MTGTGKTIVRAVTGVVVLALIAIAIGLIYKYTAGFNEDFKTFYIEHNGEKIFTERTKAELAQDTTERFDVRYTFDGSDVKAKDYSVKIVPNVTKDFDYTVNGEKYLFSKVGDLTSAFEIDKQPTYFEITLPKDITLGNVLSKYHGNEATLPDTAETDNEYPYTLIISSYNGKVNYYVRFKTVFGGATGVRLDPDSIVFTEE